jgi:5-methyltetrahydrofolate--homocysteine methyltransferase
VLRNGTPEDVEASVKDIIAASGKGGGLIIAAGGYLDEGTPAANVDAMIRACEKHGKRERLRSLQKEVERSVIDTPEAAPTPGKITLDEHRDSTDMSRAIDNLKNAIMSGKYKDIQNFVHPLLEEKVSPQTILDEAIIPAMDRIGQRFSNAEIFIPEMMVAARATEAVLEILAPVMIGAHAITSKGIVAIGTVKEDLHDIGKNIVVSMMQGGGFEVVDLGVDCPPEQFAQAVEKGARIVGLSAVLTTVLPNMKKTVQILKDRGLREKCKVLIGGAAVTRPVAQEVGADAYCRNAAEGVLMAKKFTAMLSKRDDP